MHGPGAMVSRGNRHTEVAREKHMTHDDNIAARIIGGAYDDSIEDMVHAINERRRILRHVNSATMKAMLHVGDIVELHGLRPKQINGHMARVKEVRRTRVVVEPITPTPSMPGACTVPLSCVRPWINDNEEV